MIKKKKNVSVLGAGNMGTAVAEVLAGNGLKVNIWNYEGDPVPLEQINKYHENRKYLAGVKLSKNIKAVKDLEMAVKGVEYVFLVVPSFCVADIAKRAGKFIGKDVICVDASKGLVEKNMKIVTKEVRDNFPKYLKKNVVTISGPAIAKDMAVGHFTAMDISGYSMDAVKKVKLLMENKFLKLIIQNDVIGVELGGSFKNVYALISGMCDGLKMADNTKAVFLTLAMNEMEKLIVKMGGKKETVYGLSGMGDLLGTSLCKKSRNRRFGCYLGQGLNSKQAFIKVKQTVEGVSAVNIICKLGRKHKVELPLANMIYRVVLKEKDVKKEVNNFLQKIG